ncbi:hypothetical protein V6N13_080621 [Hibiscus sabdariffa]
MVETKRSRDQSSVMNEFIIEENLESDDSEYMPYEHENSESDFLDSENDHCDATDEICDGPVHESLHSSSSDNSDSRRKKRFPEFNTDLDMKCPVLRKNLIFASKDILKEAVRQYGRVHRLHPKDPNDHTWQIKTLNNEHSCQRGIRNGRLLTSKWIAKTLLHKFHTDLGYSIPSMQQDIKEATGGYVCPAKCTRGRKLAVEMNHCRPFISVDGYILKGYYQGYLLAAVGIDANDCIYPIAVAVVEAETRDSWCWFLQLLAEDLDIVNSHHLTLMFDKQKGLIEAVLELFPHAEKRNCVRHMYSNFKNDEGFKGKALKDFLWKVARATTVRDYEKAMAEMKGISIDAYNWLKAKDPSTWPKSHFSTRSKCDILLNNYSECFNKMILEARDKPILTMMEIIRTQMMHRISRKAETAHKYTGPLCPKIQKKMDILIEQAARCWPSHAGGETYKVAFGPFDQHVVNLQTRDCSCRKWGLTGIPCAHAVSVLLLEQHRPEEYVDECYHTSTQIAIYSNLIYPIRGANQWEPIPAMEPILPPIQRKPPGRPKKTKEESY